MELWENPPFDWPPKLPKPTLHTGKMLLNLIDKEEKERIEKSRKFKMPDFRSGDVVRV